VILYRSGVFERANKKDRHVDMVLTSPVVLSGDVMVEFFNKPKMMKKVWHRWCTLFYWNKLLISYLPH